MKNVLLIGCGNIGFRHFQALISSSLPLNIYIQEKNVNNLNILKNYVNINQKTFQNFFYIDHLNQISKNLDLAIIATLSQNRFDIIKNLFFFNKPKYLILEKPLFVFDYDYKKAEKIFKENDCKVCVNQHFSSQPAFIEIQSFFKNAKNFQMDVYGNRWGICCNAVHYIELFQSFINRDQIEVNKTNFRKVTNSKRKPYFDIDGEISFKSSNDSILKLNNYENDDLPVEINIDFKSDKIEVKCMLISNRLECVFRSKNEIIKKNYTFLYVSEMSSIFLKEIFENYSCSLPLYEISQIQHLLVHNVFKKYFVSMDVDVSRGVLIS